MTSIDYSSPFRSSLGEFSLSVVDGLSSSAVKPHRPCQEVFGARKPGIELSPESEILDIAKSIKSSGAIGKNQPEMFFPLRLHRILSDPDVWPGAIMWLPHGEAFVVDMPEVFVELVLPEYFPETAAAAAARSADDKAAKYASFVRRLNRWGFHQIRKGRDAGGFRHPLFKRDRIELCRRMQQCFQESGKSKAAMSMSTAKKGGSKRNYFQEAMELEAPAPATSPQCLTPASRSSHIEPALPHSSASSLEKCGKIAHLLRTSKLGSSALPTPLISSAAANATPLSMTGDSAASISETPLLPLGQQQSSPMCKVSPFARNKAAPESATFKSTLERLRVSMEQSKMVNVPERHVLLTPQLPPSVL